MTTYLLNLLTFEAFTSGERRNNISINPAQITKITEGNRSISCEYGTFRPTIIWLNGHDIPTKVAQSRDFIHYLTRDADEPEQEYVEDLDRATAAK